MSLMVTEWRGRREETERSRERDEIRRRGREREEEEKKRRGRREEDMKRWWGQSIFGAFGLIPTSLMGCLVGLIHTPAGLLSAAYWSGLQ